MRGMLHSSLLLLAAPSLLLTMSGPDREHLEPCPKTDNCVSTQAERESQRMEPIPYRGGVDHARERLLALLESEARVRIGSTDGGEIHAVFTTRILRFKDDVVFLFDPQARLIHFRSASRVGRSDLGANRARMERLSRRFQEAETAEEPPR